MDKRTKAKVITTVVCLMVSLFALYTFIFVIDVSKVWRAVLIVVALFWIIDAISRLARYLSRG